MDNANYKEIMIEGKYDSGKKSRGTALYDVENSKQGMSFHQILTTKKDYTLTGSRKKRGGSGVKSLLQYNSDRSQSKYGDLFIDDHSHPLVFNKQSGWNSCKNLVMIATTLSNKDYAHTFAGIGVLHEQGC